MTTMPANVVFLYVPNRLSADPHAAQPGPTLRSNGVAATISRSALPSTKPFRAQNFV
ncbi:hypothetical protein [Sphingomonas sp. LaA6.9]|uniref:hypothetical protein n=1 Tax=Sphingomonas sp. LaA6.9 TaxID=2919914 RepID=UPI001F4FECC8|nr:hypothetical protein [Sphingomonas sp. LaA6.9]MCJ8158692.1 hypothetical protein [Sphingomonas sp. LaA6.9]